MYTIDNLDKVLASLNKLSATPLTFTQIGDKLDFDISAQELDAILFKLEKEGYIITRDKNDSGWPTYNLSFDGLLFLEKSLPRYKNRPYKSSLIKEKRRQIWTTTKIAAAVINAIMILSIAAWGVWVQMQTNEKDSKQVKPIINNASNRSLDTSKSN